MAAFDGSFTKATGTSEGVKADENIFIKSYLSRSGGHAITGNSRWAATTPESASERPSNSDRDYFVSAGRILSQQFQEILGSSVCRGDPELAGYGI